jgi:hypothetical protein
MKKNIRVVIPRKVMTFLALCLNIINKNTADGINSVLNTLNMSQMAVNYTAVALSNSIAMQKDKDKELANEKRNIALGIHTKSSVYMPNTVLFYVASIRDFLLGSFKNNERQLGAWNFEVHQDKNVEVPRGSLKLMSLARGIITKHQADGASSILSVFDMAAFEALLIIAEQQHALALSLKKAKELEYEKRNLLMGFGKGKRKPVQGTLLYDVMAARDILLGINKGKEQEIGLWGFEVNTSAPSPSSKSKKNLTPTE